MPRRPPTAIAILLLIGLLFLAGTAIEGAPKVVFVLAASRAEGRFVGSVARSGGNHGGTFLYPGFAFRTADGRTFTHMSSAGSTDQPWGAGDRVTILYDARNPGHAAIDSFWDLWAGTAILGIFAAMFLIIPMAVWWTMRVGNKRQYRD